MSNRQGFTSICFTIGCIGLRVVAELSKAQLVMALISKFFFVFDLHLVTTGYLGVREVAE